MPSVAPAHVPSCDRTMISARETASSTHADHQISVASGGTHRSGSLARISYDVGLRGLMAAHKDAVQELKVICEAVLSDMDYPEDYRREIAKFEKEQ